MTYTSIFEVYHAIILIYNYTCTITAVKIMNKFITLEAPLFFLYNLSLLCLCHYPQATSDLRSGTVQQLACSRVLYKQNHMTGTSFGLDSFTNDSYFEAYTC